MSKIYLINRTTWSDSVLIAVYIDKEKALAEANRLERIKPRDDGYQEYYVNEIGISDLQESNHLCIHTLRNMSLMHSNHELSEALRGAKATFSEILNAQWRRLGSDYVTSLANISIEEIDKALERESYGK